MGSCVNNVVIAKVKKLTTIKMIVVMLSQVQTNMVKTALKIVLTIAMNALKTALIKHVLAATATTMSVLTTVVIVLIATVLKTVMVINKTVIVQKAAIIQTSV
ncbi:hypothetical protein D3C75_1237390 [compost metagenome]